MSGWVVARQRPSSAVWGGVLGSQNAPTTGQFASGWLIVRRQPSTAVWGGVAAFSNVLVPQVPGGIAGDYDGKTWWKKRWILGM